MLYSKHTGVEHTRPMLAKFLPFAHLAFARRQPCYKLRRTNDKNYSKHRIVEFLKSKFFAIQGKSAVNTDVLTSILTQKYEKFAFKNRMGFDSRMLKLYLDYYNIYPKDFP